MKIRETALSLSVALICCAFPAPAQTTAGQPSLSEEMLAGWLADFKEINAEDPKGGPNIILATHLNVLNDWIRTPEDIQVFRGWMNDDEIVRRLVPLAAGVWSETRIPSTLVLGNVVDNTNVCYVIGYLANNSNIGADGQFNLLQVVRQVATYSTVETAAWIEDLVALKEDQIKAQNDVDKTAGLLFRIREALIKRANSQFSTLRNATETSSPNCADVLSAAFIGSAAPTSDLIRDQLFSDQRREYATHLAALYNEFEGPDRIALVNSIVAAIIPQKQDPDRRYRVNLYIAVTFTRMASGALTEPAHKQALMALKDTLEYRNDPTFAQNVDQAIKRQKL